MYLNIPQLFLGVGLLIGSLQAFAGELGEADLQFFGDVMLSGRSVGQTGSSARQPRLFDGTAFLLKSAKHNIVNLEGVITDTLIPYDVKRFLLPMPLDTAEILHSVGIDIATLANNHAMDFGFQGLLSTMNTLSRAGIAYAGAGINEGAAAAPVMIPLPTQNVCLLAFSRTLPRSFWASNTRAGTALATPPAIIDQVGACSRAGFYTIVAFHWGQEERSSPLDYQEKLARIAIDSGAKAVIGHHPHRVQRMELYKGRPIFYSLGNYAFGSEPVQAEQEGLAVRLTLPRKPGDQTTVELVPLAVSNSVVHFIPRPASRSEANDFSAYIPKNSNCRRLHEPERWSCLF